MEGAGRKQMETKRQARDGETMTERDDEMEGNRQQGKTGCSKVRTDIMPPPLL